MIDDDDDFMGGGGGQNNTVSTSYDSLAWKYQNLFVRTIKLRGTGWDGSNHQELMIKFQGDLRIRISRNNGSDTFQMDAHKSKYNTLVTREVSALTITCRMVVDQFNRTHQAYPAYDQADCRRFAQDIFEALDPGAKAEMAKASGARGSSAQEALDLFS